MRRIAYSSMNQDLSIRATDQSEQWLGISRSLPYITPWAGRIDALAPGGIVRVQIDFQTLRFNKPTPAGMIVMLRAEAPTSYGREGQLPERTNSLPIAVRLIDTIPAPLRSEDLPAKWDRTMSVTYRFIGGLTVSSKSSLQIDSTGDVVVIVPANKSRTMRRIQGKLTREQLDEIESLLREQQAWKLEGISRIAYPDESEIRLMIVGSGRSMVDTFPLGVVEHTPSLQAIEKHLDALIATVARHQQ